MTAREKQKKERRLKIYLKNPPVRVTLALFCCLLWGSAFPAIKLGYSLLNIDQLDVSGQALFAGCRFFTAGAVIFLLTCLWEKNVPRLSREMSGKVLGIGVVQIAIQYLLFYIGLAHITGTRGALINACQGFITVIFAHFMMKSEPMTWRKAAGCLLGFGGILVLNLGDVAEPFTLAGDGAVIAATILYAGGSVAIKIISRDTSPMVITSYQLLSGGFILILIGLALGGSIRQPSAGGILIFVFLVLISSIAFSIWNMLIKYNPVGKITIFGCSIPIFAAILSGLLLGEDILTWPNLVALLGVGTGIILVNLTERTGDRPAVTGL